MNNNLVNDCISRAEAIEALESLTDYVQDSNYENGETLLFQDSAIEQIKALPSAQPSVSKTEIVGDVISRQAAIDMLKNRWKKTRNYEGIGDDIAEECELCLKQVPSAQPTLYGYSIESLAAVAETMKKGDMSPEEALWTYKNNVQRIAELIRAEWYENIQKQFEQMMFAGGENGTD